MQPRALGLAILTLALLATAAPPGAAHNPANTVYEPAPLGEGLLVLGEEGTAAHLTLDGEENWKHHLDVHVVQAPQTAKDTAATITRTIENATPYVQAYDASGPTWKLQLDQPGAFGYVTATQAGFLAVSTEGKILNLTHSGDVRTTARIEASPTTQALPAPGDGWVLASDDNGKILHVTEDGTIHQETRIGGKIRDIARMGSMLFVAGSQGQSPGSPPIVKALNATLDTQWIDRRDGFRIGGQIATHSDRLAFGTFNPQGALLAVLTADGTEQWNRTLPDATAAAATLTQDRVYAAGNQGLYAYTINGTQAWNVSAQPRIAGPTLVQDLVLPSGAANRLIAIHAGDGSTAWTWTDNVTTVPWTDETIRAPPSQDEAASGNSVPGFTLLAGLGVLALLAWMRRR